MQVFSNRENIGILSGTGNTTVQLSPSTVTIGAQQYVTTTNISCDITVSGVGGLDNGTEQTGQYYYVYAVVNSGSLALVCSLSNMQPSGFSAYKKVGAFVNDFSGNIEQVLNIGDQPDSEVKMDGSTGAGSTLNRHLVFTNQRVLKGIGISVLRSAVNGDRFTFNHTGQYYGSLTASDGTNAQEFGISINSDSDGTTNIGVFYASNPDQIFSISRTGSVANVVSSVSATRTMNQGDYIKAHMHQSVGAGSAEMSINISKIGTNEIDWRNY